MKEKAIEKWIIQYLSHKWAVVEGMQWWGSVTSYEDKEWNMKYHKIKLQEKGCPDIICFYMGTFIGIEVKKNQGEVEKWIRNKERFEREWFLPGYLERDENQIRYRKKILKNGGVFIITCDINEVINYIESLDN